MSRKDTKNTQSAFTLIELMIVISIVGVLASIAIPQYAKYTKRAQFSEVIVSTSARKTAVMLCAQESGSLDSCNGDGAVASYPGIPADATNLGKYITSISTTQGNISVVTTRKLDSHTYTLDVTLTLGRVHWTSGGSCTTVGLC